VILLPSTRQRIARVPLLFRAHDCVDETGLFALAYGRKVYGVFARSGSAMWMDQNGRVAHAASGQPRIHCARTSGGLLVPSVLLEAAATNLCLRSDEFDNATWTKTLAGAASAPVVTANAAIAPDGTLTADSVVFVAPGAGDQSILAQGSITTVAASTYSGSLWVRAATVADVGKVILFRHVGSTNFLDVTLTASWQRVQVAEVAGGASSSINVVLRPGIGASSSGTVTALLWRSQLELGKAATSEIKTDGATATRNADSLYLPYAAVPQELTMYVRGVEQMAASVAAVANRGVGYIGPTTTDEPRLFIYQATGEAGYRFQHDPVSAGAQTTNIGTGATIGNIVEFRGVLGASGTATLGVSINDGAEATNGPSAAEPIVGAWGEKKFYLNSFGSSAPGAFAFTHAAIPPGTVSRDELRDLCEVG
jgi:hypothetical protein